MHVAFDKYLSDIEYLELVLMTRIFMIKYRYICDI